MEQKSKQELLTKADKPARDAMKLHPFYKGKVEVNLKAAVRGFEDFGIWYSPGVAAPCKAIAENIELAYEYTNKANFVAVVSDGSRVLGLGNIGPEAGLPVMEGKALLFKYLGGVDAFPICLDTTDADEIINIVKALQPSFGGINLEDIESPKCFYILERLRNECRIPVFHDDQQGTALVNLAGLYNALKVVDKKLDEVKIAMVGTGSANIATFRLLTAAGADPKKILMVDSKGILNKNRTDIEGRHKQKWELCLLTNEEQRQGGIAEALQGADVCIALSKPGPDTIKKEWVSAMAEGAVIFACANPTPEIWPWEAKEAGAKIVATGRSDFPNQVNNSMGFPAIFRGVLDVQASNITDSMCIAAAEELADCVTDLNENNILPSMGDWEVFPRVAAAIAMQAIEEGLAHRQLTREQVYQMAAEKIKRSQGLTAAMMAQGFIAAPPED